jgi:hypothetical protein
MDYFRGTLPRAMGWCLYDLCVPTLIGLLVALNCCTNPGTGPTDSNNGGWTVSGSTYLAGSSNPVAGVLVKCGNVRTTSGVNGRFEIHGLPGGTYALIAEKLGYLTYASTLEVNANVVHNIFMGFQSTNVLGLVANVIDGPISGAKVELGDFVDYTDISGRYAFYSIPRAVDTLSISHPSYLGFKSAISLATADTVFETVLKRDSVIQVQVFAFFYIDQALPTQVLPVYPNYELLYLRTSGYDSVGVYHDGIERSILAKFDFPQFFVDDRVSILEASLQICVDRYYPQFAIRTFTMLSPFGYTYTYNTRPSLGSELYSGTIGDASSGKYWAVLGVDGVNALLAAYRTTGITNGIEIKGGLVEPVGIYSSRATQNQPRMSIKVRF